MATRLRTGPPPKQPPTFFPMKRLIPALLSPVLFLTPGLSQEAPEADPAEMPRVPATEPGDAIGTFEIRPGFKLELAAHEPLVVDPIDIAFDERGRMFVVEMRGYSEHREEALGRVKMLVDEDDDGVFDKATIYAEGLKWPTSVCCYDGGVFVTASPDIFYFKDTDGDGVSDQSETVFTGFGQGLDRLNMQALVNSLTWGPDNRIWGATARNGGRVRRPDQTDGEAISLNGADFSFDPKTRELRAENGTAQFGMSFDSLGRRFVCSNSNHIQWIAWERNWVRENPYFSMPAPMVSIAADGAAAPVYRISPDEPWRIVRTRWRVSGVVKGAVEGGGRVSGYFTAATGITLYTGDAYGPEFRDNAFIGDAGSNLVHRKIVATTPNAARPAAVRADDERETEFLRSRDNWFRPVNFENGPDGCLYICDMYRETIEHPWSIPEGIKKHVDLDSGNDRGRIWRVVPEEFQRPAFSPDRDHGWARGTRARLAYESGNPSSPNDAALARIRSAAPADPWRVALELNSLTTPAAMIEAWTGREALRSPLAEMIGKTGDAKAIGVVIDTIVGAGVGGESAEWLSSLGSGLGTARLDFAKVDPDHRLGAIFDAARSTAGRADADIATRASALDLIRHDADPATDTAILAILAEASAPDSLRAAAIRAASARPGDLSGELITRWPAFSPTLRTAALDALTASAARATALLESVKAGAIPAADIPANTAELLRGHRDAGVKSLAATVLPAPPVVDREAIVKRYLEAAAKLTGDPARGKLAFLKGACITCHKTPDGQGMAVGPDVATFKTAGADSILKNVIDPNAEVAPQYQTFTFDLHNGETLMGIIAREDATEVTLRMPGGLEKTFLRKEVAGMKGLGRSLMPEGLDAALSEQDMADLLAYIAAVE